MRHAAGQHQERNERETPWSDCRERPHGPRSYPFLYISGRQLIHIEPSHMGIRRILVANRGEIAVRIIRAADELEIATTAVYAPDDAQSLHVARATDAHALTGRGTAAYLDIAQLITAAREHDCDAVHPGYGFLAENPSFAAATRDAGLTFIGPAAETLTLFGDKLHARAFAQRNGVAVPAGSSDAVDSAGAHAFFSTCRDGALIIKAVAGGGGRGMRVITAADQLNDAFKRCTSEAQAAFGDGRLYVEELLVDARHVEVQILGDGAAVSHLWERECTLQRRHQKLIEVAPSPSLSDATRTEVIEAALRVAGAAHYRGLGTFEFLIAGSRVVFIEANPRLQVEHTVTEEITGIDLVKTQIRLAQGATLAALGLTHDRVPAPRGFALQARVNMETMTAAGEVRPSGRSCRYVRLRRLYDDAELRLAAREGHCPQRIRQLR
jgi:pyruvate carboxylase